MNTYIGNTVKLVINTGIDISGYSILCIKYRKPDGTIGTWSATLDSSDNKKMTYTCEPEDLDQPGEWVIQASVEEGTQQLNGRWIRFNVYEPLRQECGVTLAPTTA